MKQGLMIRVAVPARRDSCCSVAHWQTQRPGIGLPRQADSLLGMSQLGRRSVWCIGGDPSNDSKTQCVWLVFLPHPHRNSKPMPIATHTHASGHAHTTLSPGATGDGPRAPPNRASIGIGTSLYFVPHSPVASSLAISSSILPAKPRLPFALASLFSRLPHLTSF